MKKYPSIVQNYKEDLVDTVKTIISADAIWVAEEKIDGSNFQLETDGKHVRLHSRTVADSDKTPNFFVEKAMVDDIKIMANEIHDKLAKTIGETTEPTRIFTEYFGGYYGDGSLVMKKPMLQRVLYSRKPKIIVFSIKYNHKWLSPKEMEILAEGETWPFIGYLKTGTLDELLALDPKYPTSIPQRYGLNPLPNNMAEGYVLKPYEEKIEKFDSFITCIKIVRWGKVPDKVKMKTKVMTKDQKTIAHELQALCDVERYFSTLSKYPGEWDSMSDNDKVSAILTDAGEEYLVDNPYFKKNVALVTQEYYGLHEHVYTIVHTLL